MGAGTKGPLLKRSVQTKEVTMPKGSKTRKTALQRFKITGKGKLKRKHAMTSHLRSKESGGRNNRKKGNTAVSDKFEKTIKRMLQI